MPISKKIIDKVDALEITEAERALMMEILKIEDKGSFRFEAVYEKAVKDYITAVEENGGVV